MEEGGVPPVSSAPSSAGGSDCTPGAQAAQQQPAVDGSMDERLAMLQEVLFIYDLKFKPKFWAWKNKYCKMF
jgi:hypothetical protein